MSVEDFVPPKQESRWTIVNYRREKKEQRDKYARLKASGVLKDYVDRPRDEVVAELRARARERGVPLRYVAHGLGGGAFNSESLTHHWVEFYDESLEDIPEQHCTVMWSGGDGNYGLIQVARVLVHNSDFKELCGAGRYIRRPYRSAYYGADDVRDYHDYYANGTKFRVYSGDDGTPVQPDDPDVFKAEVQRIRAGGLLKAGDSKDEALIVDDNGISLAMTYHAVACNCEHVASWILTGVNVSLQASTMSDLAPVGALLRSLGSSAKSAILKRVRFPRAIRLPHGGGIVRFLRRKRSAVAALPTANKERFFGPHESDTDDCVELSLEEIARARACRVTVRIVSRLGRLDDGRAWELAAEIKMECFDNQEVIVTEALDISRAEDGSVTVYFLGLDLGMLDRKKKISAEQCDEFELEAASVMVSAVME